MENDPCNIFDCLVNGNQGSETDIVMVVKHKKYEQHYSNLGFQFERFVTSKTFHDPHKNYYVEHLQLMKVAGYGVLLPPKAMRSIRTTVQLKKRPTILSIRVQRQCFK